jgi:hypothetical protein
MKINLLLTAMPTDTASFLEYLDKQYPHRCPTRDMSPWDIAAYAGKRELIDVLMSRFKSEESNIIRGKDPLTHL